MAKRRIVNTKFWSDTYIADLDPSEKLLFMYFLTNPYTNISGIYEISLRQAALDTGLDKEIISKILKRFEAEGKMVYRNGWIAIKNFIKHQEKNPLVEKGIDRELKNAPTELQEWIIEDKNIGSDSLSYLTKPNLTKPNLVRGEYTPAQEFSEFIESDPKREAVISYLVSKGMNEAFVRREITKFISYWTELSPSGRKQRWQMEKTFELKRRLITWLDRAGPGKSSYPGKKRVIV